MISTHRDGARVGTISSPYEYYLEWKDPFPTEKSELGENPNSQQILIEGLLKPKQFLDIMLLNGYEDRIDIRHTYS